MEDLIELVAASFARHGIECPPGDSQSKWKSAVAPIHVGTAASGQSNSGLASAQTARPAELAALPEHNYRKSLQGDPAP